MDVSWGSIETEDPNAFDTHETLGFEATQKKQCEI